MKASRNKPDYVTASSALSIRDTSLFSYDLPVSVKHLAPEVFDRKSFSPGSNPIAHSQQKQDTHTVRSKTLCAADNSRSDL